MQRFLSLRKPVSGSSSFLANLLPKATIARPNLLNTFPKQSFSVATKPRGENATSYDIKDGDVLSGFRLLKTEEIPLYSMKAFILEHEKTKARYVHLHAPDQNNCFAVLLRTTPSNDKGTPHILEHIVLCGSEKYPVRDPFFNMLKRSLNTYMNAWTGNDFTCYPFATQNEKDYKNLRDVYVESVYKPLIKYHDFLQEGWRYDFSKEGDHTSDLVFKGIVYNEMKGVMQTPDNLFSENLQKYLHKDNPYHFCSGGLPKDIRTLSYQELKQFYKRFYHPSNSYFYSYGDLDFRDNLKYLENNYLKNFEYLDPKTEVPLQEPYKTPMEVHIKSPPDAVAIDPEKQAKMGISFLCNNVVDDPVLTFSLQLLSYMLFETPSSPFYKSLLESGLATGYCPSYGYELNLKQGILTVGVRNIGDKKQDFEEAEAIINETLSQVATEGFSSEFIESALHQAEVQAKLPKTDAGITFLQTLIPFMNHNGDPLSLLRINEIIQEVRARVEKGGYFEGLIKKYMIENNHRVKLIMTPDSEVVQEELKQEKGALEKAQKELSEAQKKEIVKENVDLKASQETKSDINILPTLGLEDIPKSIPITQFKTDKIMDIPVMFTEQPTNGITYLRFKVNLRDSPLYFKPFLRLFSRFFTKLGTKNHKHDKFSQLLDLYTYNLDIQHISYTSPFKVEEFGECVMISIACLEKNIDEMFKLFSDIILNPNFREFDHIKNLLQLNSSEAANSFMEDSLTYAMSYAAGGLREAVTKTEKLQSARFLCNIGAESNKAGISRILMEEIERNFIGIMGYILRKEIMSFCVHGSQTMYDKVHKNLESFLKILSTEKAHIFTQPGKLFEEWEIDDSFPFPAFQPTFHRTHFTLPSQVNYAVESVLTPHYTHHDTPKLHILGELMSSNFLLREIREKGGAYGAGSQISPNGVFNFYSYRDPNLLETYDAFQKSVEWASSGEFSEQDIKEAKLKVFSSIDQVESPLDKGLNYFIKGISDEMRNEYRQNLLKVTKEDVVEVGRSYLLSQMKEGKTSKVVFGKQNNDLKGLQSQGWSIETPVEGLEAAEGDQE